MPPWRAAEPSGRRGAYSALPLFLQSFALKPDTRTELKRHSPVRRLPPHELDLEIRDLDLQPKPAQTAASVVAPTAADAARGMERAEAHHKEVVAKMTLSHHAAIRRAKRAEEDLEKLRADLGALRQTHERVLAEVRAARARLREEQHTPSAIRLHYHSHSHCWCLAMQGRPTSRE